MIRSSYPALDLDHMSENFVLAFLDVETGGLSAEKDPLLEIGCLLFDAQTLEPIESHSWLLYSETNEAEKINNISLDLLKNHGRKDFESIRYELSKVLVRAHVVLTWNVAFDRPWIDRFLSDNLLYERHCGPWVCAMEDLTWPKATSLSLSNVALAYDLAVLTAHRALPDVQTMARLFRARFARSVEDRPEALREEVQWALRPKARYESLAPYNERDLVKSHRFRWDGFSWTRSMFRSDVPSLPFRVREVIPEGKTWMDTHQGLRVMFVSSLSDDASLIRGLEVRSMEKLSPRSFYSAGELLFDDSVLSSFAPELVVLLSKAHDVQDFGALAESKGYEVIRPKFKDDPNDGHT